MAPGMGFEPMRTLRSTGSQGPRVNHSALRMPKFLEHYPGADSQHTSWLAFSNLFHNKMFTRDGRQNMFIDFFGYDSEKSGPFQEPKLHRCFGSGKRNKPQGRVIPIIPTCRQAVLRGRRLAWIRIHAWGACDPGFKSQRPHHLHRE